MRLSDCGIDIADIASFPSFDFFDADWKRLEETLFFDLSSFESLSCWMVLDSLGSKMPTVLHGLL